MRPIWSLAAISLALATTACTSSGHTGVGGPSPSTTPLLVSGTALEVAPGSKPLAGVRIQVTGGPDAGEQAVTGGDGSFQLQLTPGVIGLDATKDGYFLWRVTNLTIEYARPLQIVLYPTPPRNPQGVEATARCSDGTWAWDVDFAAVCAAHGGLAYSVCPGPFCERPNR
jgi:hypothetical protein